MIAFAARLATRGVVLRTRAIVDGDERGFDDYSESQVRRRASGAARIAARAALAALGGDAQAPLPRSAERFPIWPEGFVGSLAHDEALAAAVVGRAADFDGLGVDVEPAEALPEDVAAIALFGAERRHADSNLGRAVFAAKEAVYKAINPFDGTMLEYEDIAIDLEGGSARLRDGRMLSLDWAQGAHIVVAATAAAGAFG